MAPFESQAKSGGVWALARRQERLVTRAQLMSLGYGASAIKHRIAKGRLHPVRPGIYAVGSPWITRRGERFAAVLTCGPAAAISDESAAAELGIRDGEHDLIDVTIPAGADRRPPGIRIHRRDLPPSDIITLRNLPLTSAVRTLLDLATRIPTAHLERAVNEADRLDLIDPESLRTALDGRAGQRGVGPLRALLDRQTFRLTDSELERRFLAILRRAGLPLPETQVRVNGYRVDFFFPGLGLVVETDGLRYHRTPSRQARDARRDQAHAAAGLSHVRFSHSEVRFEPGHVQAILRRLAARGS